jgi:hypothetical protein
MQLLTKARIVDIRNFAGTHNGDFVLRDKAA